MSLLEVGPQTLYLYAHKWDVAKDTMLIACLIQKIEECAPSHPDLCPNALIYAMMALNSQLKANVSLIGVEERVNFLRNRYVCFKYLSNLSETVWDTRSNVVHDTDEVWIRLFKKNCFFRAYYHRGEPEIYQMCALFGIHDVKEEMSHTVILIENSSTVNKQSDHKAINEESSEDEVTSPILKLKRVMSKELFPDDACSIVAPTFPKASKTKMHGSWSAIKNKFTKPTKSTFPARNAFPMKPKEAKNPDAGKGGSSCALSSPFK